MNTDVPELWKSEIKKAFAVCDLDGSGFLSQSELTQVMRSILEEEPPKDEVDQIFGLINANKNGRVSFDEFETTITQWLKDCEVKEASHIGEKNDPEKERSDVHKKIKTFFRQFRKSSNFDQIRHKMKDHSSSVYVADPFHLMEVELNKNGEKELTSNEKLQFLVTYRTGISNSELFLHHIKSTHIEHVALGVKEMSQLLKILEIFSTPVERRSVAEDIIKIFALVSDHHLISPLSKCLICFQYPELQLEALKCLTLLAPGPCIASTPIDHFLHPDKMLFKRLIFQVQEPNIIQLVIGFLKNDNNKIKEQTLQFITSFGLHHPECRDILIHSGALPLVLELVKKALTPVSTHSIFSTLGDISVSVPIGTKALCVLVGVSHPLTKLPQWEAVSPTLETFLLLLSSQDEKILVLALQAVAFLFPGVPNVFVCRRLTELLSHSSTSVRKTTLHTLASLFKFDPQYTQILVRNCNLLVPLGAILNSHDSTIKPFVCEVISVLEQSGHILVLIESGIIECILGRVLIDEYVRPHLIKLIKQATRSGGSQGIQYFVQHDIIKVLCNSLSHFKAYDPVLLKEYKYVGATFSFELVDDILSIFEDVYNVGEADARENFALSGGRGAFINKGALLFDLECVDKMRMLLQTIADSIKAFGAVVDAWRSKATESDQKQIKNTQSTEERLKYLLWKVGVAHKNNVQLHGTQTQENIISKQVVQMIEEIWSVFYNGKQVSPTNKILLKCYLNEYNIRVVEVAPNILLYELTKLLESKFDVSLTLIYKDEENDGITIDSQELLSKVLSKAGPEKTVKIFCNPTVVTYGGVLASPTQWRQQVVSPFGVHQVVPTLQPVNPNLIPTNFVLNIEEIKLQEKKTMYEQLAFQTHFGINELDSLYQNWASQAKNGQLRRPEFEAGLKAIGVNDPLTLEQYWCAFDASKDGCIDFREFVTGLSVLQRGTLEERLQFMFKAFDTDGSNYLSKDEMVNVFRASLLSRGINLTLQQLLIMVDEAFNELDLNRDGKLDYAEFKNAVQSQRLIINLFVHGSNPNVEVNQTPVINTINPTPQQNNAVVPSQITPPIITNTIVSSSPAAIHRVESNVASSPSGSRARPSDDEDEQRGGKKRK